VFFDYEEPEQWDIFWVDAMIIKELMPNKLRDK